MTHFNAGVTRRHRIDAIPPELTHIQHIGFINGTETPSTLLGDVKGHLGDAINLRTGVGHRVETTLIAISLEATLGLTEINSACQFSYHHQVHALNHLTLEAAGIDQSRNNLDRTEVGEKIHTGPEPKQAGFRPLLTRKAVETRAADGGQQNRIRGFAGRQSAGRERFTRGIDGAATDRLFLEDQFKTVPFAHRLQQPPRHGGDLRADAVAGEQNDAVLSHDGPEWRSGGETTEGRSASAPAESW